MAYSGQTTHYGLPKYVSTDKPSWLDTNDAFDAIDAAIYAAATAVDPSTITTMQNDITALQSGKQDVLTFDSAPVSGSINPVTSGGVYTAVNNVSIALGVTDLKVSTLEGAMGNTDISAIGDGTVTGAIDALNSNSALINSTFTYTGTDRTISSSTITYEAITPPTGYHPISATPLGTTTNPDPTVMDVFFVKFNDDYRLVILNTNNQAITLKQNTVFNVTYAKD